MLLSTCLAHREALYKRAGSIPSVHRFRRISENRLEASGMRTCADEMGLGEYLRARRADPDQQLTVVDLSLLARPGLEAHRRQLRRLYVARAAVAANAVPGRCRRWLSKRKAPLQPQISHLQIGQSNRLKC
jgi:hypothetical protein